jgi:hypothetical protein
VARLPISYLAPLIVYFVLRPHVTSDTEALAIAWFIPIVWTLGSSLWLRHLEVFALLSVVAYGIALSISIVFGAGALPLKLHHALVAGAVGLVCLVSVAIGRPFFLLFIRRRTKQADQAAQVEIALGDPQFARRITDLTLLIGIAPLADAVFQTALAVVLSTSTFLVATTTIRVATIVGDRARAVRVLVGTRRQVGRRCTKYAPKSQRHSG